MTHPRIPTGTAPIPVGQATHIEPEVVTLPQAPRHTPGPWWLARAHPSEGTFAVGAGNSELALVLATTDDTTAKANARLIAAAPDLLQACRDMLQVGMSVRPDSVIWAELRAAIARATGE